MSFEVNLRASVEAPGWFNSTACLLWSGYHVQSRAYADDRRMVVRGEQIIVEAYHPVVEMEDLVARPIEYDLRL
jgi:hypothetical protein